MSTTPTALPTRLPPPLQALADAVDPRILQPELDALARRGAPAVAQFPKGYSWSLTPVEYALNLVFQDPARQAQLFADLAGQAGDPGRRCRPLAGPARAAGP